MCTHLPRQGAHAQHNTANKSSAAGRKEKRPMLSRVSARRRIMHKRKAHAPEHWLRGHQ